MLLSDRGEATWRSVSDLMAGLMMVFLFLAVAFLYELQSSKKTYEKELHEALVEEFRDDLARWSAKITEDNIVRFDSPFKVGDARVNKQFQTILNEFFPRYVKLLSREQFKNKISEVRIEGHTSDIWGAHSTRSENYLNNMKLSQERALNVLGHVYRLSLQEEYIGWLEAKLRANGMAFALPIYQQTGTDVQPTPPHVLQIDREKSRRVEFKVLVH